MTTITTCCRCGQTFMAPAEYFAAWCSPDCELDALSAPAPAPEPTGEADE